MIDELKELVTMLEKVPETALWILGGFAVYKLTTYLAATGAIVVCIKLGINKLTSLFTKISDNNLKVKTNPKEYDFEGNLLGEDTTRIIGKVLQKVADKDRDPDDTWHQKYFHTSDAQWLKAAVDEKLAREKK